MRGREDANLIYFLYDIASHGVNVIQGIDIVAEEFNAHRTFLVGRNDIYRIALGAEGAAGKPHVIAFILDIHQQSQEPIAVQLLINRNDYRAIQVRLWSAQAINAGHGRDYDHVPARQ